MIYNMVADEGSMTLEFEDSEVRGLGLECGCNCAYCCLCPPGILDEETASIERACRDLDRDLGEDRIGSNRGGPDQFIDGKYYLCEKNEWTDAGQKRQICLESLAEEGPEARSQVLFELTKEEWMIRKDRSAFADSWSCPALLFTYCPGTRTVFYALNQAYQIHAADPEGNPVRIIHRVHQPVKVGPKDKELLASWALRNEQSRWIHARPGEMGFTPILVWPLPRRGMSMRLSHCSGRQSNWIRRWHRSPIGCAYRARMEG